MLNLSLAPFSTSKMQNNEWHQNNVLYVLFKIQLPNITRLLACLPMVSHHIFSQIQAPSEFLTTQIEKQILHIEYLAWMLHERELFLLHSFHRLDKFSYIFLFGFIFLIWQNVEVFGQLRSRVSTALMPTEDCRSQVSGGISAGIDISEMAVRSILARPLL